MAESVADLKIKQTIKPHKHLSHKQYQKRKIQTKRYCSKTSKDQR